MKHKTIPWDFMLQPNADERIILNLQNYRPGYTNTIVLLWLTRCAICYDTTVLHLNL